MKIIRQMMLGTALGIMAWLPMLSIGTPVLAAVGNVTDLIGDPSNISIILKWVPASGSDNTTIRYRTDGFPTTTTNGTLAYNDTGFQTTVSSLTAGQIYYFSAWGYEIATGNYSSTPCYLAMSTLAIAIPSGAATTTSIEVPKPTLPASINQAPTATGFNLEPFTSIIAYFNNTTPGGLGMPVGNAWETLVIMGIVIAGLGTYMKIKNFFVAFAIVFFLTVVGVGLHLIQGWLVGVEIVVGGGVWAIERYMQ